jgi:DNA-binding beta-propeller fold protein YncE
MKSTLIAARLSSLLSVGTACLAAALVGCAPAGGLQERKAEDPLVYPAPPDTPRFVFERAFYSSADVTFESEDSILRRTLTGSMRTGEGLGKPYAVAVHRGRVFVSDSVDRFIKVFDVPQARYFKIGEDGDGQITKPLGIDVDDIGNLYVADATAKVIVIFDRDGKFQRKIGSAKYFDRLSSVTVDPGGERIYVTDIGGVASEHHRVRVFNAKTGEHLFDIGKRGSGPGEFNLPRDVAIGKDGRIHVVDGGNFRVQSFDRNGKFLKTFGQVGKQLGHFARPKEIATDREGNLYVADSAFGNFQIFSPEGELLMFIGQRSEQDGPAKYMLPSGIAVDDDGRIYFVDQWFKKVDVFRPHALGAEAGSLVHRPKPKPAVK